MFNGNIVGISCCQSSNLWEYRYFNGFYGSFMGVIIGISCRPRAFLPKPSVSVIGRAGTIF